MPQAGAEAWWAEVEHLREDLERRREAERTGFERIARRPGGRFVRGQTEQSGTGPAGPPAEGHSARAPRPAARAAAPGDPFGAVELVTPLDRHDTPDDPAALASPTRRFPRRDDQPAGPAGSPPADSSRAAATRASLRAQAADAVALDVPGWDAAPRRRVAPGAPASSTRPAARGPAGERRTVHIRGRGAEHGGSWTVPGVPSDVDATTTWADRGGLAPVSRGAAAPAPTGAHARAAAGAAPATSAARVGGAVAGRRPSGATVSTAGRRRRPPRTSRERLGHRPDRVALWALLLGFVLALTAAITADAATRLGDRTLERGMVGRDVRHLQLRLDRLGFFDPSATGRFGAVTERAVRRYQRSRCLTVDGIAGPSTIRALRSGRRACRRARSGGRRVDGAYRRVELGTRVLVRGMAGRDVRSVQHLLDVRVTGTFGPITARAVRRFQRRAGLEADGAVGPATRAALAARRMVVRTVTWYGPGLYGNRTACGQTMTRRLVGVAHRRLPCGARVTLHRAGRFVTVPVVDRGPFVRGVSLDLTAAAARRLGLQQTEQLRVAS